MATLRPILRLASMMPSPGIGAAAVTAQDLEF